VDALSAYQVQTPTQHTSTHSCIHTLKHSHNTASLSNYNKTVQILQSHYQTYIMSTQLSLNKCKPTPYPLFSSEEADFASAVSPTKLLHCHACGNPKARSGMYLCNGDVALRTKTKPCNALFCFNCLTQSIIEFEYKVFNDPELKKSIKPDSLETYRAGAGKALWKCPKCIAICRCKRCKNSQTKRIFTEQGLLSTLTGEQEPTKTYNSTRQPDLPKLRSNTAKKRKSM
jgi:hypothetical protein